MPYAARSRSGFPDMNATRRSGLIIEAARLFHGRGPADIDYPEKPGEVRVAPAPDPSGGDRSALDEECISEGRVSCPLPLGP